MTRPFFDFGLHHIALAFRLVLSVLDDNGDGYEATLAELDDGARAVAQPAVATNEEAKRGHH